MRPRRHAAALVKGLAGLAASLAFLAAAAPSRAAAGDPASEAARSYTLEAKATPATLQAGGTGALRLTITPVGKTHVHPQAPLKVTLGSSAGLTLAKATLGRADLADPKADSPRFEVPFTAAAAGAQTLTAKVDFFICSDQWCVKQVRELSIPVDVK